MNSPQGREDASGLSTSRIGLSADRAERDASLLGSDVHLESQRADAKRIARTVGVPWVNAVTIIHTAASDADQAARLAVLGGAGKQATSQGLG